MFTAKKIVGQMLRKTTTMDNEDQQSPAKGRRWELAADGRKVKAEP